MAGSHLLASLVENPRRVGKNSTRRRIKINRQGKTRKTLKILTSLTEAICLNWRPSLRMIPPK